MNTVSICTTVRSAKRFGVAIFGVIFLVVWATKISKSIAACVAIFICAGTAVDRLDLTFPKISPRAWTEEMRNVQSQSCNPLTIAFCKSGPLYCYDRFQERSQRYTCGTCKNECDGAPRKVVPLCFRIVKLLLAFLGFDDFHETVPFSSFFRRFCAVSQFNVLHRIDPESSLCISGPCPKNDYRKNWDRKLDLSESAVFFNRCIEVYEVNRFPMSAFRKHMLRILHIAYKAYFRFEEKLDVVLYENRRDTYSRNIKNLKCQLSTREEQTDVFVRVGMETKMPVSYRYDHWVRMQNDRWDVNFPMTTAIPEPESTNRWDANFPTDVSYLIRHKFLTFRSRSVGCNLWIAQYKPDLSDIQVEPEEEEVLKDVARQMHQMHLEFSDDLDEQVGLIEQYYQNVLSLRDRKDLDENEIKKKMRNLIMLIHSDKCIQFTHGLSDEAKATYASACEVFIRNHNGLGKIISNLR